MIGPDTLYCDESGMWDKDSPQCIALPEGRSHTNYQTIYTDLT